MQSLWDDMASNENPENYEQEHVHTVYEQIADHFSSTRYKVGKTIQIDMYGSN